MRMRSSRHENPKKRDLETELAEVAHNPGRNGQVFLIGQCNLRPRKCAPGEVLAQLTLASVIPLPVQRSRRGVALPDASGEQVIPSGNEIRGIYREPGRTMLIPMLALAPGASDPELTPAKLVEVRFPDDTDHQRIYAGLLRITELRGFRPDGFVEEQRALLHIGIPESFLAMGRMAIDL